MENDFNFDFANFDLTPNQPSQNHLTEQERRLAKTRAIHSMEKPEDLGKAHGISYLGKAHVYRRAYSEKNLMDIFDDGIKNGYNYHVISWGDVDAFSFLKLILRHQKLDYLLFSTWVMAREDCLELEDFVENGRIKKVDAFLGENFLIRHPGEYEIVKDIAEKTGGSVIVARNHAKIFAGYGEKFYFAVESSANINTNPRIEQTCLSIRKDVFEFYYNFFTDLKTNITKWRLKKREP